MSLKPTGGALRLDAWRMAGISRIYRKCQIFVQVEQIACNIEDRHVCRIDFVRVC